MLDEQNQEPTRDPGRRMAAIVLALGVALAIGNLYSIWRVQQLQEDMQRLPASLAASLATELSNLRQASQVQNENAEKSISHLREKLEEVRGEATETAGRARREALQRTNRLAKELAKSIEVSQLKQKEEIANQFAVVRQATDDRVTNVMNHVQSVSTEVDKTKSDLEKTASDLKSVIGDLGLQSGLVATNSKQIAALRALGERNYFEFDLKKLRTPTKIADVQVWLKSSDPKRNRYSLVVLTDDKRIEKKDKTINEPVQFYASKIRQPYELVVNEVAKNRVVGYLATPKVQQSRR